MNLAVIPARGGSKRIPRKNIRDFGGKPIIAWTIEAARAAGVFDAIIVSTDDDEVAAVAEAHGAEAPFRRPAELASDNAGTVPVVAHAVDWFEHNRYPVSEVCCLYATAPFLRAEDIRRGRDILLSHPDAEFAFTATSYAFPIFRALHITPGGSVRMFWPENNIVRSQDLPEAWHDAGQFYWGHKESFRDNDGFFSAVSYPVILPRHLVQDIDTPEDWAVAESRLHASRSA